MNGWNSYVGVSVDMGNVGTDEAAIIRLNLHCWRRIVLLYHEVYLSLVEFWIPNVFCMAVCRSAEVKMLTAAHPAGQFCPNWALFRKR